MSGNLSGRKVAFLVAPEGVEQVELTEPWKAVQQAGGQPELVSVRPGSIRAFNHLDKADTFPVDKMVTEVSPDDYDGLVLPGGVANPDRLRTVPNAVRFVREFFAQQKPVAAICHAPWMLVEADVVRGRRVTSYPSVATDLRNAEDAPKAVRLRWRSAREDLVRQGADEGTLRAIDGTIGDHRWQSGRRGQAIIANRSGVVLTDELPDPPADSAREQLVHFGSLP